MLVWLGLGFTAFAQTEPQENNQTEHFESESGIEGQQRRSESDIDPNDVTFKEESASDQKFYSCIRGQEFSDEAEEESAASENLIEWTGDYINYRATVRPGVRKIDYEDSNVIYRYRQKRDGITKIDFESDIESYRKIIDRDGNVSYEYYINKGNEILEVQKSPDGSGTVNYEGNFDNLDQVNESSVIELGDPVR